MSSSRNNGWMNGYEAIDSTVDAIERSWGRLLALAERAWRVFGMERKLQMAKQYAMEHPVLTLCGLITTCMCSIPIMCFLFFVTGTLFFTFLGFLFVEGFLLTFASILLGGALFIVGFLSVGASSFLALAWYTVSAGSGLVTRAKDSFTRAQQRDSSAVEPRRSTRHEHSNGECVKDRGTEKEE